MVSWDFLFLWGGAVRYLLSWIVSFRYSMCVYMPNIDRIICMLLQVLDDFYLIYKQHEHDSITGSAGFPLQGAAIWEILQ